MNNHWPVDVQHHLDAPSYRSKGIITLNDRNKKKYLSYPAQRPKTLKYRNNFSSRLMLAIFNVQARCL